MNPQEEIFRSISNTLISSDQDVQLGKMMCAPGLKYNGKVFAFFHKGSMEFRLGPSFDPEKMGIKNANPLSPFKQKPPLKGLFIIEQYESKNWIDLSEMALEFTKMIK